MKKITARFAAIVLSTGMAGCAEVSDVLNSTMSAMQNVPVNLVQNGSFEQPVVPVGKYQLFNTGQSFPGWQVVGANGNVVGGGYGTTSSVEVLVDGNTPGAQNWRGAWPRCRLPR